MSAPAISKKAKSKKGSKQKTVAEQGPQQLDQLPTITGKIDNKLLLHIALKFTVDTGIFYDTKFYAFSRRRPDGLVHAPKAIYANGWLLRTRLPSYFEQLLSDTYGDCIVGNLDGKYPASRQDYAMTDDYDSDSDLEDDPDEEGWSFTGPETGGTHVGSAMSGSASLPQSEEEVVASDLAESSTEETKIDTRTAGLDAKPAGRIIVLPAYIAYATWKALIFYLYTGEITFNRLKSQEAIPATANKVLVALPPSCSPKSMYRLADRLGLDELKAKARQDIISKLSSSNVLDELFSSFAFSYDEIREAEVNFVCQDSTRCRETFTHISKWSDRFAAGDLPRSAHILTHLVQKLASRW